MGKHDVLLARLMITGLLLSPVIFFVGGRSLVNVLQNQYIKSMSEYIAYMEADKNNNNEKDFE